MGIILLAKIDNNFETAKFLAEKISYPIRNPHLFGYIVLILFLYLKQEHKGQPCN